MAKIIAKQNDEYSCLNNLQVSPASQNDSGDASVVVCLANSTGSRITEAHLGPSRITHPGRSMRVFLEKRSFSQEGKHTLNMNDVILGVES